VRAYCVAPSAAQLVIQLQPEKKHTVYQCFGLESEAFISCWCHYVP